MVDIKAPVDDMNPRLRRDKHGMVQEGKLSRLSKGPVKYCISPM